MFLLDTNACIDFVDARSERVKARIEAEYMRGLHVSSITAGELLVGAREASDPKEDAIRIDRFIRSLRLHDFDEAAARQYATIARAIGVQRKSFDRLIAAHALSLGLVLVTSNSKHFDNIPGLKVENWAA